MGKRKPSHIFQDLRKAIRSSPTQMAAFSCTLHWKTTRLFRLPGHRLTCSCIAGTGMSNGNLNNDAEVVAWVPLYCALGIGEILAAEHTCFCVHVFNTHLKIQAGSDSNQSVSQVWGLSAMGASALQCDFSICVLIAERSLCDNTASGQTSQIVFALLKSQCFSVEFPLPV